MVVGTASRRTVDTSSSLQRRTDSGLRCAVAALIVGLLPALAAGCTSPSPDGPAAPPGSPSPTSTSSSQQSGTSPPDLTDVAMDHEPTVISYGLGSAWVTTVVDALAVPTVEETVRIVPSSNAVTTTVKGVVAVAFDGTAMWAVDGSSLRRIDPDTGKSSVRITIPGAFLVSVGAGSIWVNTTAGLGRVDPRTDRYTSVPLPDITVSDIAATDTAVWITDNSTGLVAQLDPRTSTIVGRLTTGGNPHGLAVDAAAIWVPDQDRNVVLRIDPATTTVAATVQDVGSGRGIAVCAGAVWASAEGEGVYRIDPATNQAGLTIPLPGELVYGIACGDHELWLSSLDAKVVHRYPI